MAKILIIFLLELLGAVILFKGITPPVNAFEIIGGYILMVIFL